MFIYRDRCDREAKRIRCRKWSMKVDWAGQGTVHLQVDETHKRYQILHLHTIRVLEPERSATKDLMNKDKVVGQDESYNW